MKREIEKREVVVTNIDMKFGTMVWFMVKWVIATIPALLILFILFSFFTTALAVIAGA